MCRLVLESSLVEIESFTLDSKREYIKRTCLEGYVWNSKSVKQDVSSLRRRRRLDMSRFEKCFQHKASKCTRQPWKERVAACADNKSHTFSCEYVIRYDNVANVIPYVFFSFEHVEPIFFPPHWIVKEFLTKSHVTVKDKFQWIVKSYASLLILQMQKCKKKSSSSVCK